MGGVFFFNFEARRLRYVGSITKNFSCITLTVEHNYISSSSTVGIQLHVSALTPLCFVYLFIFVLIHFF